MRIQSIHLTNFRNFHEVGATFGPRRNLILGGNAQGKTNLLEAIHILGVGRSHRDRKDANLVRFDQDYYRLEGVFDHIGVRTTIEVAYGGQHKRIRLNAKEAKPAELIGLVGIVISSPEDIDLIKGPPGFRRTFLDMAISQISREYLANLQQYLRALAQRNRLLKAAQERRGGAADSKVWEKSLIEAGSRIVESRLAYLGDLKCRAQESFGFISGRAEPIELSYDPRGYRLDAQVDIREALGRILEAHRDLEIMRGYTLFGPHVDDFRFLASGKDVRQFGSEGEQRTSVLALRCAEVGLMKEKNGRYPIVLLDDVFAELDPARTKALTALISGFDQIILTSSRPAPPKDKEMWQLVVEEGRISHDGTAGEGR